MEYEFSMNRGDLYQSENSIEVIIHKLNDDGDKIEDITLSIDLSDNQLSFVLDTDFEKDSNPGNGDIGFIIQPQQEED